MHIIKTKSTQYNLTYERPVRKVCEYSYNCKYYNCKHYGIHKRSEECKKSCIVSNNSCSKLKTLY